MSTHNYFKVTEDTSTATVPAQSDKYISVIMFNTCMGIPVIAVASTLYFLQVNINL